MTERIAGIDVSRETSEKLRTFSDLVLKWTQRINLISPGTVQDIWHRHIVDSAQIYPLAPPKFKRWVDIGSGGGFPGIVVAILAQSANPGAEVILIESDQRKSTFLRTAVRQLELSASVISSRIEEAIPCKGDIVSARALAPLDRLLPDILRHLLPDGIVLLHKGRQFAQEIAVARQHWSFDLEDYPSLTDPDARLLKIQRISRD